MPGEPDLCGPPGMCFPSIDGPLPCPGLDLGGIVAEEKGGLVLRRQGLHPAAVGMEGRLHRRGGGARRLPSL